MREIDNSRSRYHVLSDEMRRSLPVLERIIRIHPSITALSYVKASIKAGPKRQFLIAVVVWMLAKSNRLKINLSMGFL
ncbi:MAG: hypothetical protein M1374_07310 [Firmicutes bacterium]|jgi:hypothetical protein|nr:hypothetical protein [Bacillota bacterium]